MKFLVASLTGCLFLMHPGDSYSQENNVPEEVRALAILCSSGASIKFRGEIEGGLNRLFGKIIAGTGDLEVSENETDFLNSFSDENLKLEARRVYNECALGALQIVYNKRQNASLDSLDVSIVVPETISEVPAGNRFALQPGGSVLLEGGGLLSVQGAYNYDEKKPVVVVSNEGRSNSNALDLGEFLTIPNNEKCHVTYYHSRPLGSDKNLLYSFLFACSGG